MDWKNLMLLIISLTFMLTLIIMIILFYFGYITSWHIGKTNYYRPQNKDALKIYVKLTRRISYFFIIPLLFSIVSFVTSFFETYYLSAIFVCITLLLIISSLFWFNLSKTNKELINLYMSLENEYNKNPN